MKRDISDIIEDFILREHQHKSALVLEGARQVGKTFLIKQVLSQLAPDRKVIEINLEEQPLVRDQVDCCADFAEFEFLAQQEWGVEPGCVLFIDEAQESEKLGSFVRFMKEKWQYHTVLLTGSSMSRLFAKTQRIPVGRIEYLRLYPFSFREFLRFMGQEAILDKVFEAQFQIVGLHHAKLLQLYDQYLSVGGLPEVVEAFCHQPQVYAQRRREIYISQQDDFHRKVQKLRPHLFKAATEAAARCLGSSFKLTSIDNNHRDAKQALELLCQWHILESCEQKGLSPTSQYNPKVYLYDIGLAKSLRELSPEAISLANTKDPVLRVALGGLLENAVYLSLLSGKGFLNPVYGWRKDPKNPVEVDFIFPGTKVLPIEVKAATKFSRKHVSGLLNFMEHYDCDHGVLLSAAPFAKQQIQGNTIWQVPAYLGSAELFERLAAGEVDV